MEVRYKNKRSEKEVHQQEPHRRHKGKNGV